MKIKGISLKNFKRFTDLTIDCIPGSAKLVLLIGSNGSGKSSIFDAFHWLNKGSLPYGSDSLAYYRKDKNQPAEGIFELSDGSVIRKTDWTPEPYTDLVRKFIGRSSNRIVPHIGSNINPDAVAGDEDRPLTFIENDERFVNDVHSYIQSINDALREPVFSGKPADTLKIFRDFIEPFNTSLSNIFGESDQTTIRIVQFEDALPRQSPAKLIFQKGGSKINYDLLSHGEKQVVVLLLNFIVRQQYYRDAIIYIDEMDLHLNTGLQYNVLKEITERWIPATSQLWTATHALGFIDYAHDYDEGVVLDLDNPDYDKPQTIFPARKDRYEIFELAVSKEFLGKVFNGRRIIFSEGTNTPVYNDLAIKDTFFFDGRDKMGAFQKAKNLGMQALIDRDFLSDNDMEAIRSAYPFVYILPYYSIENLLYHPDNLSEYNQTVGKPFNREKYVEAVVSEKNSNRDYIVAGIDNARRAYPFFKDNEHSGEYKSYAGGTKTIIDMLRSDDFETFYKVFPAKDYGGNIPERQNISKKELSKTQWFRNSMMKAVDGV